MGDYANWSSLFVSGPLGLYMCLSYVQDTLRLACWLNTALRQGFLCGHRSPLPGIAIHLPRQEPADISSQWMLIDAPLSVQINYRRLPVTPVDMTCAMHRDHAQMFFHAFSQQPNSSCFWVETCRNDQKHGWNSSFFLRFWHTSHDLSLRHPPPTTPPVFGSPRRAKHLTDHQHAICSLGKKHHVKLYETARLPPVPKRLKIWFPLRNGLAMAPSSLRYPTMVVRRIIGSIAASCLFKQREYVLCSMLLKRYQQ